MHDYGIKHEKANIITHFFGFLLGIIAVPILFTRAYADQASSVGEVFGVLIYGISILMVFGFSSLYHYQQKPELRKSMKIWDHISIYYLIAGTYTPFLMRYASDDDAKLMLVVLWLFALAGTVFKVFFTGRFRLISTGIYLGMGWLIVFSPESFREAIPDSQIAWIAAGGVFYTLGVLFYLVKKIPYHHAIWHLFVLGGAACHFAGVAEIYFGK